LGRVAFNKATATSLVGFESVLELVVLSFVRFQTEYRCRDTARPLGLFHSAGRVEDTVSLPSETAERLSDLLSWFNKNLTVPSLDEYGWRCVFWFFSSATEFIDRMWDLTAMLKVEGVIVRKIWTTEPGRIVYTDRHQIGAVP
jgi:hypothetical protein